MIRLLPAVALALLLVGDGVFYAMTSPSRMFSAPPSFGSGENPFGAEANAESSAAEGETLGNPRPDFAGADSSDFPAFDGVEGGTPPGFGGSGTFPGAPASINTGAFRLMRWRFLCLPVGALLLIAEGVCILGLRRKKDSPGETITTEELDPAERRMRSERRTRRIGMGVLCGILILALVLQLVRSSMGSASSVTVNEEVRSIEATEGTLEHTLQSAGVVASAEEETLSVPGSVRVTEYLVSDGDAVEAGDDIAVLERNSVLSAIADAQALLKELDGEIDEVLDSSTSSYITAPTGATVVKVYAKSGESVTDVMYDHEALALLSLDGLLAVKIDNPGGYTMPSATTCRRCFLRPPSGSCRIWSPTI